MNTYDLIAAAAEREERAREAGTLDADTVALIEALEVAAFKLSQTATS